VAIPALASRPNLDGALADCRLVLFSCVQQRFKQSLVFSGSEEALKPHQTVSGAEITQFTGGVADPGYGLLSYSHWSLHLVRTPDARTVLGFRTVRRTLERFSVPCCIRYYA
jgi:hypothetical protein